MRFLARVLVAKIPSKATGDAGIEPNRAVMCALNLPNLTGILSRPRHIVHDVASDIHRRRGIASPPCENYPAVFSCLEAEAVALTLGATSPRYLLPGH